MAQTLARAQAAVAALARDYVRWARSDLTSCQNHLDAALAVPAERATHIRAIFALAHNIKGQGGSFGFPLITRIGQSLSRLTQASRTVSESDLQLVASHLQALRYILDNELTGDGNPEAQSLVTALESRVATITAA